MVQMVTACEGCGGRKACSFVNGGWHCDKCKADAAENREKDNGNG